MAAPRVTDPLYVWLPVAVCEALMLIVSVVTAMFPAPVLRAALRTAPSVPPPPVMVTPPDRLAWTLVTVTVSFPPSTSKLMPLIVPCGTVTVAVPLPVEPAIAPALINAPPLSVIV